MREEFIVVEMKKALRIEIEPYPECSAMYSR
jgi:hypothetical protein